MSTFDVTFLPEFIKIQQCLLNLQLKCKGSFLETVYNLSPVHSSNNVEATFDIVEKTKFQRKTRPTSLPFGNKVERCIDIVAKNGNNVAYRPITPPDDSSFTPASESEILKILSNCPN